MTIVYFDSSAFVKLLVEEEGSDTAAALWDGCDAAVSRRFAYPEVRAALAAAGRAGRLDRDGQRRTEAAWEDFWSSTRTVELTAAITTMPVNWQVSERFEGLMRCISPACWPCARRRSFSPDGIDGCGPVRERPA